MVSMPHWPIPSLRANKKYDLENITNLLAKLGNPHLKLPPAIHIAGTNGKGSTIAFLKSIFEAANYKVHSYTSPHLIEFNERIVLSGEKISDEYLFNVIERTRIAAGAMDVRFFEGITAAAFLAFSEVNADILLLETGMGGRLDATNVIPKPLLSVITSISYDHMEYLGPTLPIIAGEKAGIIKPHVPCVISKQVEEVHQVLEVLCAEKSASSFSYEYDFGIQKNDYGFSYISKNYALNLPSPSLPGDHQLINAAGAIASVLLINQQFNIKTEAIASGIQNVQWPARIQKITPKRYSHLTRDNVQIWLDGAHNSGGAEALASWINKELTSPTYLILGMTKNRNIEEFCKFFLNKVIQGYAVRVLSEPSSYSAETLSERASSIGIKFLPADSIEEAIMQINKLTSGPTNIVICGSLFLASDLHKLLANK